MTGSVGSKFQEQHEIIHLDIPAKTGVRLFVGWIVGTFIGCFASENGKSFTKEKKWSIPTELRESYNGHLCVHQLIN